MKLLILSLCFSFVGLCQPSDISYFNEIDISLNHTTSNVNGELGFGFGIYHKFRPDKRINILVGPQFNHTRFNISKLNNGSHTIEYNVNYRLNYISFPILSRVSIGENYYSLYCYCF